MTCHTDAPVDRIRDVLGSCSISRHSLRCSVLCQECKVVVYVLGTNFVQPVRVVLDDPVADTVSSHTKLGFAEVFSWVMLQQKWQLCQAAIH